MKNDQKGGALLIVILLIVVAIAGGILLKSGSDDSGVVETKVEKHTTESSNEMVKGDEHGTYEDYSPEKVVNAKGRVLLFFHAAWCPTCRAHEKAILENINSLPEDLSILKVNYDTETELKQKYGIRFQHSFVQVDNDGNEIVKWLGGNNVSDILSNLK